MASALMQRFSRLHPIARASITSGTIMAVADVACQKIQAKSITKQDIDWRRTARFSIIGFTLHGPYFFTGFGALDRIFGSATSLQVVLTKTTVGQLTMFPVYVSAFFFYMGLLEGKDVAASISKTKANFVPTYISGSVFWPIANIINFRFVPSTQRLLYINMCGLAWNAFLSWMNSQQRELVHKQ